MRGSTMGSGVALNEWIDMLDDAGWSPMDRAVHSRSGFLVDFLGRLQFEPPESEYFGHIIRAEVREVREHIEMGADPNAIDSNGLNGLHYAALNGCVDLAKLLLNRGASPHLSAAILSNATPAQIARDMGYKDVAAALAAYGGF